LIDQDDYREWKVEAKMTARNGSAEWHGNLESGSGTITVGEGVFEGPYSY